MADKFEKECYKVTEKIINFISDKCYKQLKKYSDITFYDPQKIEWFFDKYFHENGFYFFDKYTPNGTYKFDHIETTKSASNFEIRYQLTHGGIPSGLFMILRFDLSESQNMRPALDYCLGMPSENKNSIDKELDRTYKAAEKKLLGVLKDILKKMNAKKYNEISTLITDTKTGNINDLESFLIEFVQGTVEANELKRIDKFSKNNDYEFDGDGEEFSIEYILSADGGEDLPLCLSLTMNGDEIVFDIQPD